MSARLLEPGNCRLIFEFKEQCHRVWIEFFIKTDKQAVYAWNENDFIKYIFDKIITFRTIKIIGLICGKGGI